MKHIAIVILSVTWMLLTVLATITFIGMFLFFIQDEEGVSYWFLIGKKLFDKILL